MARGEESSLGSGKFSPPQDVTHAILGGWEQRGLLTFQIARQRLDVWGGVLGRVLGV